MAWGKVDDRLHSTRKWRRASKGARALWTTALSWCMSELTDGHIPADMLAVLDGTRTEARSLVDSGLWHEEESGWYFHDWLDYQPAREQVIAEREAARERQRVAREKAREKRLAAEGVTGDVTAKSQRDSRRESQGESRSPRPDPTRPDPTEVVNGSPSRGGEPKRRAGEQCPHGRNVNSPCGACADARRTAKQADADELAAKRSREQSARDAKRARILAGIAACHECDERGYLPGGKACPTNPDGTHHYAEEVHA